MDEDNHVIEPLEPTLEALFRESHRELPPEAFVAGVRQRTRRAEQRARILSRCLQLGALAVVILASPWLIAGSESLSALLDQGFALISDWLGTPVGTAAALVAAAAVAAAFRLGIRPSAWLRFRSRFR